MGDIGRLCIHTLNSLQSVLQNLMEYALQVSLPTVRVLTIADKVQWNIAGARNLLMHRALHCRTVMMDIDYIMPESLAVEMLKAKAPSHVIYRLKRNHPGKDPMHPGIMFTSPHTYFGIGGADEDFAGHYGFTDPHLVLRAQRARVQVTIFRSSELLVPQPKSIHRPSVERDRKHNTKLFESKKEGKVPWSNTYLRFRWTESVISKQDRSSNPSPECVAHLFDKTTPNDYEKILAQEGRSYKQSRKFMIKIEEAEEQWKNPAKRHGGRFGAIHHWLEVLLQDKQDADILELGFGAGTNMIVAKNNLTGSGSVWGIELTEGWVEHAQRTFIHERLHFLQGDITRAAGILSSGGARDLRFDLIFLADVWEHIPAYRLKSTWETVVTLLKPTGRLYIHIPDEQTQMQEQRKKKGQYFEQIVRVEDFKKEAECFGMSVLQIEGEKLGYVSIVAGFVDASLVKKR